MNFRHRILVVFAIVLALVTAVPSASADRPAASSESRAASVVLRARLEVERKVTYDPAYVVLAYPNGDVAVDRGVCTDVVIRAYRTVGIDLQARIHQDILRRPSAYTTVKRADANIDHRRVAPMLAYMRAHATAITSTFEDRSAWQPGDVVVWSFRPCPSCSPNHVGVVSDKTGPRGLPLVIHNIGPVPSEDDTLDAWTVLGHFRVL
ncbi:MAG: DUF1287 domain-containing protein [Polyangiaceae bacterium]|nr:DUF1287 domain-containing protein [Polyangiaceae bacterium]